MYLICCIGRISDYRSENVCCGIYTINITVTTTTAVKINNNIVKWADTAVFENPDSTELSDYRTHIGAYEKLFITVFVMVKIINFFIRVEYYYILFEMLIGTVN